MRTILLGLVALSLACGDDDGLADGGNRDATTQDAPVGDSAPEDGAAEDVGPVEDAGAEDVGASDGGEADASGDTGSAMTCGGLLGEACADTEFCLYDRGCGFDDGTGVCTQIPEACPRLIDPVCGCNGVDYPNECLAHANGVSAQSSGACAPTETRCGARLGDTCARGEYCRYTIRDICGAADATGICSTPPERCEPVRAPVCSCNGMSFGNECLANMAGQSVASLGPCE